MKRIILIVLALYLVIPSCFAINWETINSYRGISYIDTDSITKTDKYYFYNIKIENNNEKSIITIQSSINSPFSAKIKIYTEKEYIKLSGDYKNIQNNQTTNLEPAHYGSVVNSAYKYIKTKDKTKDASITIINKN